MEAMIGCHLVDRFQIDQIMIVICHADDFDDDVVDGNDSEMASQNTSDQEDDAMPLPIVRGGNGTDSRNEDTNRRSNGEFFLSITALYGID